MALASVLVEVGLPLREVQQNKGTALFVFTDSENLRSVVSRYLKNDIQVSPKSFLMSWKSLRTKITETLAGKEKS